jgi:hypothetical protein
MTNRITICTALAALVAIFAACAPEPVQSTTGSAGGGASTGGAGGEPADAGTDVNLDAPLTDAGVACAERWGADLSAVCTSDADCTMGKQWCMTVCAVFHADQAVYRCAPLKDKGQWCDHVGGDHECQSGKCNTDGDTCE